jgi:hypothetical protein
VQREGRARRGLAEAAAMAAWPTLVALSLCASHNTPTTTPASSLSSLSLSSRQAAATRLPRTHSQRAPKEVDRPLLADRMAAFGGARGAGARPPEKGIFPLDHFGECKKVCDRPG